MTELFSTTGTRQAQAEFLRGDITTRVWSGAAGVALSATISGLFYDGDPETTIYYDSLKICPKPESVDSMCQQSIQRC